MTLYDFIVFSALVQINSLKCMYSSIIHCADEENDLAYVEEILIL